MLVEMNAATDAEFLPLCRRIAADADVVLNDAQLLSAIAGNGGLFRSVIFSVVRLANNIARQQRAADIAAASIQQAAKKLHVDRVNENSVSSNLHAACLFNSTCLFDSHRIGFLVISVIQNITVMLKTLVFRQPIHQVFRRLIS